LSETTEYQSTAERVLEYRVASGVYDELLGGDGRMSSAWQYLMQAVGELGGEELAERQRKVHSLLRDDGAAYYAYGSDRQQPVRRQWGMDLLPWVIGSEQWREIETGLLERSELFDLLLKDIYGDRTLIQRGVVPPEVLFGHRGFLRASQGVALPGDHQLLLHAADLVRQPNGEICVLADRTQAPSGSGYALANRIVSTRVLPSTFRDSDVHRLSGFFQSLRAKLMSLAPESASPNIAILTPGPLNETYFEHAYLASYLGFELVQASDLAVRRNALWMKTLDGWEQVHVLWRRVDDDYCDPVELKSDSQLGVPGLLEVARAGNVVVVNPIGSGVLESPALLAYLPAIARHFLGRELQLPSVKTWWCGDADSFDHVVKHIDQMVIKPVFRSADVANIMVSELDESARADLLKTLVSKPDYFVAQERLNPSHLPVLSGAGLAPRPAILRAFSVASEGAYRLMPGGLTRVGAHEGAQHISNQLGSVSKDTWIVASESKHEGEASLDMEYRDPSLVDRVAGLPSRVIENMFWLGRYAERAEFGLRLTRTLLLQSADIGSANDTAQQRMLAALVGISDSSALVAQQGLSIEDNNREALLMLVLDPARRESVVGSLHSMLACADETKELLTFDSQRVINQIRDESRQLVADLQHNMFSAPEDVLSPVLTSLLALSGIFHESVNRGMGWNFLDLGRRLERGIQSAREISQMLGTAAPPAREQFTLESLLSSNESLVFYRRIYRGHLELRNVLELLLLDHDNPRGMLFQLARMEEQAATLPPGDSKSRELTADARCLLEAKSLLQLVRLDDLCVVDETSQQRPALLDCCHRMESLLSQAAIALSERYFDRPIQPKQLLRQHWELAP
jgi:uncharacterized circularly permuted ATP-grasp superfamily protein/uncharacterized alpha-E superfamily protein